MSEDKKTQDQLDAEQFADSESRKLYSHTIYAAALDGFLAGRKGYVPTSEVTSLERNIDDLITHRDLLMQEVHTLNQALKHEVEKVDQIIAGTVMKERERCAEIAKSYHGCSGLQTAKAILNPPKDESK